MRVVNRVCLVVVALAVAVLASGCGSDDGDTATITIVPLGDYLLDDINIDRDSDDTNYADPSAISDRTSYEVPPGTYDIFLRYHNLDSGVSGVWQSSSFDVAEGDDWVAEYGYFGGDVERQ